MFDLSLHLLSDRGQKIRGKGIELRANRIFIMAKGVIKPFKKHVDNYGFTEDCATRGQSLQKILRYKNAFFRAHTGRFAKSDATTLGDLSRHH